MSCRREAVGGRRVVEKVLGMVWSKGRNSGRRLSSHIISILFFYLSTQLLIELHYDNPNSISLSVACLNQVSSQ